MPSAKKPKIESVSARLPGSEGAAPGIIESSTIVVNPPTSFPLELANSNQTLVFDLPSNPRWYTVSYLKIGQFGRQI